MLLYNELTFTLAITLFTSVFFLSCPTSNFASLNCSSWIKTRGFISWQKVKMSAACDSVYGYLFLLLTITNFTDRGQKIITCKN